MGPLSQAGQAREGKGALDALQGRGRLSSAKAQAAACGGALGAFGHEGGQGRQVGPRKQRGVLAAGLEGPGGRRGIQGPGGSQEQGLLQVPLHRGGAEQLTSHSVPASEGILPAPIGQGHGGKRTQRPLVSVER